MYFYQITITSKNEKSFKDYLKILLKNITLNNLTTKLFNKKKKKFFITVLKSPHVNKKAQEQFGYHIYSKQLLLSTTNGYQWVLFLKKIEKNLFSDINLKIKFQLNNNLSKTSKRKVFNPDNFQICFLKTNFLFTETKKKQLIKNNNLLFKKTKLLLQIFDIYGEINKKITV